MATDKPACFPLTEAQRGEWSILSPLPLAGEMFVYIGLLRTNLRPKRSYIGNFGCGSSLCKPPLTMGTEVSLSGGFLHIVYHRQGTFPSPFPPEK